MIYNYPDGLIDIKYLGYSLSYGIFDKLERINQGEMVKNKRLGAVLKLAITEQKCLESEGLRKRAQSIRYTRKIRAT